MIPNSTRESFEEEIPSDRLSTPEVLKQLEGSVDYLSLWSNLEEMRRARGYNGNFDNLAEASVRAQMVAINDFVLGRILGIDITKLRSSQDLPRELRQILEFSERLTKIGDLTGLRSGTNGQGLQWHGPYLWDRTLPHLSSEIKDQYHITIPTTYEVFRELYLEGIKNIPYFLEAESGEKERFHVNAERSMEVQKLLQEKQSFIEKEGLLTKEEEQKAFELGMRAQQEGMGIFHGYMNAATAQRLSIGDEDPDLWLASVGFRTGLGFNQGSYLRSDTANLSTRNRQMKQLLDSDTDIFDKYYSLVDGGHEHDRDFQGLIIRKLTPPMVEVPKSKKGKRKKATSNENQYVLFDGKHGGKDWIVFTYYMPIWHTSKRTNTYAKLSVTVPPALGKEVLALLEENPVLFDKFMQACWHQDYLIGEGDLMGKGEDHLERPSSHRLMVVDRRENPQNQEITKTYYSPVYHTDF